MIQVFLCHVPGNAQREEWLGQCLARWNQLGVSPHLLHPSGNPQQFQRDRRIAAEKLTPWWKRFYILADDDCLPLDDDCVERGIRILRKHRQYASLAMFPKNEGIQPWTPNPIDNAANGLPADYAVQNDENIMEHVSIGGIRFCRRGCLKDWPAMPEWGGYDRIQADALRAAGYRVGYIKTLHFEHLGQGATTVWTET